MDNEQPHGSDEVGKIENTARGSVYGFVVQTGVVHGGLHLTPAAPAKVIPRQLPGVVPHFVGRKAELDALSALAAASYTVDGAASIATIGGAAGVGKTSLALHWARLATQRFPDGQLYVNLRGFDPTGAPVRPEEAVRTFLSALHVPSKQVPVGLDGQVGLYRSLIADRRLLVILDNARDTEQVRPLLPGSRACFVIITSRNRLTGLIVHDGAEPMTVDLLTQEESAVVITRRLGQRRVSDEQEAVSKLVNLCAGLPLALAIVSARAASHPTIPLAELATELWETRTGLDAFDTDEINVNLRAVFSWSNSVLSNEATMMFRLFGISPGPDISLKAAASLAGVSESKAVAMLGELQGAHLVQRYMSGRYRMHDLVRLYAREQTDQLPADDHQSALERLFSFYVHTLVAGDRLFYPQRPAIKIAPPLPGCATQPMDDVATALAWFDAERSSLLAAQARAALGGLHEWVWQMAWALTVFLWWRGHLGDNVAVWRTGLAAAEHLADRDMQALSRRRLGDACSRLGLHTEAIDHLRLALTLAEQTESIDEKAHVHYILARALGIQGDDQGALTHAVRSMHFYRRLPNPAWYADALNLVGWYSARLGDLDQGHGYCQRALALSLEHQHAEGEAAALDSLGYIAQRYQQGHKALQDYQRALDIYQRLGNTYAEAHLLDRLGYLWFELGDEASAAQTWQRALDLYYAQNRMIDAERLRSQLKPS